MTNMGELSAATPPSPPPSPVSLRIVARSPTSDLEEKTVTIPGDSSCGDFLAAADRELLKIRIGESPVVYFKELVYERDGECRRALWCYDEQKEHYDYFDLEDGREVAVDSQLRVSLLFRLRAAPPLSSDLFPYMFIESETEFLEATAMRQLEPTESSALRDPAFCVSLHGIRSGERLFWELSTFLFFICPQTGQLFFKSQIPEGPKRHVIALFRYGDPVPRIKTPKIDTLRVFRRAGLEPRIIDGCVSCERPPEDADLEAWDYPWKPDVFEKDFTYIARKK